MTKGQEIVLRHLDAPVSRVGIAPGALGRIVASLLDRGWATTNARHRESMADLSAFSITRAGRDALGSSRKQP